MANQPEDREDLLREATALVERAEFTVVGIENPLVIGFRGDGSCSVFLGADPVYQFNIRDQLRRAYRHGFLFKAEDGRLVRLRRKRTARAVELLRHELSNDQQLSFLDELKHRLTDLRHQLNRGNYQVLGQIPHDVPVMARIQKWLAGLPLPPAVASSARLGS